MTRLVRSIRLLIAVAIASVLVLGLVGSAAAHESREVGDFEFVVGFVNEPAYVNEMNGIDLRISRINGTGIDAGDDNDHDDEAGDADHSGGEPVENAHESLRAAIIFGGETMELDLRPVWGQPGAYTAEVIPTRTGAYTFQIIGELDGQEINETFRAGPDTFSEIESRDELFFPSEGATGVTDSDQIAAIGIAGVVAGLLGLVAGAAGYYKATTGSQSRRPSQRARAQQQGDE